MAAYPALEDTPGSGWVSSKKPCSCVETLPACPCADISSDRSAIIILELDALFRADPDIDEYAFLPRDALNSQYFCTPEAHKLAISSSVAKALFKSGRTKLMGPLMTEAEIRSATRAVLLVNGDCHTTWNARKRLVTASTTEFEPILSEIALCTLIFSARPKSTHAWSHRRWVCLKARSMFELGLHKDQEASFWQRELACCEDVVRKHPKNYWAWSHRLIVCSRLSPQELMDELTWAEAFVARSLSDHSAAHHCEQIIITCLRYSRVRDSGFTQATAERLLELRLHTVIQLVRDFPGNEALWMHLRGLVSIAFEFNLEIESSNVTDALASLNTFLSRLLDGPLQTGNEEVLADHHLISTLPLLVLVALATSSSIMFGPPSAWSGEAQRKHAASFGVHVCRVASKHPITASLSTELCNLGRSLQVWDGQSAPILALFGPAFGGAEVPSSAAGSQPACRVDGLL